MKIYAICYEPNLILQGSITLTWDSLTKHNSKMSSSFNDLKGEEPINDVIHLWLYVTYPQLKKNYCSICTLFSNAVSFSLGWLCYNEKMHVRILLL